MKLVVGARQSGKTTKMVAAWLAARKAGESAFLLVHNRQRANEVLRMLLSPSDFTDHAPWIRGVEWFLSGTHPMGVTLYVEDLDLVLPLLLKHPVVLASATADWEVVVAGLNRRGATLSDIHRPPEVSGLHVNRIPQYQPPEIGPGMWVQRVREPWPLARRVRGIVGPPDKVFFDDDASEYPVSLLRHATDREITLATAQAEFQIGQWVMSRWLRDEWDHARRVTDVALINTGVVYRVEGSTAAYHPSDLRPAVTVEIHPRFRTVTTLEPRVGMLIRSKRTGHVYRCYQMVAHEWQWHGVDVAYRGPRPEEDFGNPRFFEDGQCWHLTSEHWAEVPSVEVKA